MIYIGIDPGKDGAMAIIYGDGSVNIYPFSEEMYKFYLEDIPKAAEPAVCCLEQVGAFPGQSPNSMFSFGENYGFIRGLLLAYGIPYELVTPRKWKREFGLTGKKETSISVCRHLFPNVSLRRTERCKKDHDGMAEALLLACYAKRKM